MLKLAIFRTKFGYFDLLLYSCSKTMIRLCFIIIRQQYQRGRDKSFVHFGGSTAFFAPFGNSLNETTKAQKKGSREVQIDFFCLHTNPKIGWAHQQVSGAEIERHDGERERKKNVFMWG